MLISHATSLFFPQGNELKSHLWPGLMNISRSESSFWDTFGARGGGRFFTIPSVILLCCINKAINSHLYWFSKLVLALLVIYFISMSIKLAIVMACLFYIAEFNGNAPSK